MNCLARLFTTNRLVHYRQFATHNKAHTQELARIKEAKYRQYIEVSETIKQLNRHRCCCNDSLYALQFQLKQEVEDTYQRWRQSIIED